MTDSERQSKKRILLRLSNGVTTVEELKRLNELCSIAYKHSGRAIESFILWQCYKEMERRLKSSVFSDVGRKYLPSYKRFCIQAEYHNTKLFIDLVTKLIKISTSQGDITKPSFYGLPQSKYSVSTEALVHIIIRHNETINSFINPDSTLNKYAPSSFSAGVIADPMMTLFMALEAIDDNDWQKAETGKNLICHFQVGGRRFTIVRKGQSNEIKSIYPRNDRSKINFIELERNPDKMEMSKINRS